MGTSAEIIIRAMTPKDIASVSEIETHSFSEAWSPELFQSCIESPKHKNIVADLEGKICAYAILEFDGGGNVFLLRFAVAQNFRRKNLGKTFLDFLINGVRQNVAAMFLHVNTKNVAAIHLYESCGFKVLQRIENFYTSNNDNAFTMGRRI